MILISGCKADSPLGWALSVVLLMSWPAKQTCVAAGLASDLLVDEPPRRSRAPYSTWCSRQLAFFSGSRYSWQGTFVCRPLTTATLEAETSFWKKLWYPDSQRTEDWYETVISLTVSWIDIANACGDSFPTIIIRWGFRNASGQVQVPTSVRAKLYKPTDRVSSRRRAPLCCCVTRARGNTAVVVRYVLDRGGSVI